tara:strand:- start:5926 stop:6498 length:573 start_codon:yes stop_codon:yes gene_type:complete
MIRNKTGLIKSTLFAIVSIFIIGCEDEGYDYPDFKIQLEIDLPQDDNGFYHMTANRESWQSIKRLQGRIVGSGKEYEWWERDDIEMLHIDWKSSHYWTIGDTLGYVVKSGYTDEWQYVGYDTTYVYWFNGFEVPTVNPASYPSTDPDTYGEINTMFAPVQSMIGDTISVNVSFTDFYYDYHNKVFNIIVE